MNDLFDKIKIMLFFRLKWIPTNPFVVVHREFLSKIQKNCTQCRTGDKKFKNLKNKKNCLILNHIFSI